MVLYMASMSSVSCFANFRVKLTSKGGPNTKVGDYNILKKFTNLRYEMTLNYWMIVERYQIERSGWAV